LTGAFFLVMELLMDVALAINLTGNRKKLENILL
jgi:hypothetical protein